MTFQSLVDVLSELEATRSRNLMTQVLAEYLRGVSVGDIGWTTYVLLGRLGPLYAQMDFGLADKMVVRSLAVVSGKEVAEVSAAYKQRGDLGEVAFEMRVADKPAGLRVHEVYQRLLTLARMSGKGSQEGKVQLLSELLCQMSELERKYVVRIVLGKMRLGFSDKTILDALAVMEGGLKAGRRQLEQAYQMFPDIGTIAVQVKTYGVDKVLSQVKPVVGVPIMPALAQRLKTSQEMIEKMGKVIVEPKFDGTRVQLHYRKDAIIKTFARSLEENTAMFPELTEAVQSIRAESVILDCEAVGYDPVTGVMRPFQETMTRKRKYGIAAASKAVPIRFHCFDVLFHNGESLLDKPLFGRRDLLQQIVEENEFLQVDDAIVTESAVVLREFHTKQLQLGLEGAMVKQYDGVYQPGRTGWNWVKFKEVEEACGKLSDTIDGVVMGYYRGKGKRSAFGIGAFLLGIMDVASGQFRTMAKIGTGLSDDQWRAMRLQVDEHIAITQPKTYVVAESLMPDVWAEPEIVVEIAADEITRSPLHSSGWSLRFPRLVRFRDDKSVQQVTTVDELRDF